MGVARRIKLGQQLPAEGHRIGVAYGERELITTQPPDQVTVGKHPAGPVDHRNERRIPGAVTAGLVDRSEAVQVHEQHGEL